MIYKTHRARETSRNVVRDRGGGSATRERRREKVRRGWERDLSPRGFITAMHHCYRLYVSTTSSPRAHNVHRQLVILYLYVRGLIIHGIFNARTEKERERETKSVSSSFHVDGKSQVLTHFL